MKVSFPSKLLFSLAAAGVAGFALPQAARAQAAVGIWDLSSWNYTGAAISTTTINSTGPKVSGLSMTSSSSTDISLAGGFDGIVTSAEPILLVNAVPQSETLDQKFFLDKPVNFGPLHSQSQFNEYAGNNNGVGVAITIPDYELVTGYTLTLILEGGGTFKTVDGTFVDEPTIILVDNRTVTLTWTTLTFPTIIVDGVTVAGAIQSFEAQHEIDYLNTTGLDVETENAVSMIVSNAPPEKPEVVANGRAVVKTNKRRFGLKGLCDDYNDDVVRVEVKVGKKGYRKARGLDRWRFVARGLKNGRNKCTIRAIDSMGKRSKPDRLVVVCNR